VSEISFGVNDPLAVARWRKELAKVAPKDSFFFQNGFVSSGSDNIIRVLEDLKSQAGYKITFGLRGNLQGSTVKGDSTLEGNENDLKFFDDSLQINQERIALKTKGKADAQNVPYDLRAEMRDAHSIWWGEHFDEIMIAKLSGAVGVNTFETMDAPSTDVAWDNNSLRAPSTNRIMYSNDATSKATLGTNDTFSLDDVDKLLLRATRIDATTTRRKLQPLRIGGQNMYVLLIDKVLEHQLRTATSGRFYDLEKAKIQGGFKDSALVQTSLGVYRNVILHSHEGMIKFNDYGTGPADKTAVRSLFMGAMAGAMAMGSDNGANKFSWHEKMFDYDNKLGVATGCIWGFQKTSYATTQGGGTREDYGVIALDSYYDATIG
jgi:N4-gp56 family major capsid protein